MVALAFGVMVVCFFHHNFTRVIFYLGMKEKFFLVNANLI
jgi:hypothetical protein